MNFIAHIHLSGLDQECLVGNFIADFIRPKELKDLPKSILKGVKLHHFIDRYTDHHQINLETKRLLYPDHGKYAPVLLDIYYDYFLIRHWERFHVIDFEEICRKTYEILGKWKDRLPRGAREYIERLLVAQWLEKAYSDLNGLKTTFHFLKQRVSYPHLIEDALDTLIRLDGELDRAFLRFYPELMKAVRNWQDPSITV